MKKTPLWKIRLYVRGITVGVLALIAVAMLGEVARQNWHNKVTAYPTKTETAIENRAQQLMGSMTLEEKVGQMFMVSCSPEERQSVIDRYAPGGITLLSDDFAGSSKNQVSAHIEAWQSAAKIPMLVGVNEEGGKVVPISSETRFRAMPFLSARELYTTGGLNLVETDTAERCRLLNELGINLNFAPVADVTNDPTAYMYDRAVGQPGAVTGRYVRTVVSVMNEAKVISVLKHFPGYGDLSGNTTEETVVDDRPAENFSEVDFLPFIDGIAAEVPVILVGHTVCVGFDDAHPASLSEDMHKVLRKELGFRGVIATDDLTAGAVTAHCGTEEAAVTAIRAGNDLLCTSDYTQIDGVLEAVRSGELSEERINESVLRILKLKIRFNLI